MTVEEIRVRLSVGTRDEVLGLLWQSQSSSADLAERVTMCLCRHAGYETDICVFVMWHHRIPARGSPEGIRIAAGLGCFGSVRHTVWYVVQDPEVTVSKGEHRDL